MNKRQIKKAHPVYLDYYRLKPERDLRGIEERYLDQMEAATNEIWKMLKTNEIVRDDDAKKYGGISMVKQSAFLAVLDDFLFNHGTTVEKIFTRTMGSDERNDLIKSMRAIMKYCLYDSVYVGDVPEENRFDSFDWMRMHLEVDRRCGILRVDVGTK